MSNDNLPLAVADRSWGLPLVWLLPIITLIIGGWLLFQGLKEAPIEVYIQFSSGEGIKEGRTEIKFKGMTVGRVKEIIVNRGLQSVTVTAEIEHRVKQVITSQTRFWLVKPEVSLAGISGLETLVSGTYITFKPGNEKNGIPQRSFVAVTEAPPLDYSVPGLHLTLMSEELGSIFVGAPVVSNDIAIGSVQAHSLRKDGRGVDIDIYIEPQYRYLVRSDSRFYNASGISFSGSFSGFKLQVNSLASVFVGGIALYNNESENAKKSKVLQAENGDQFFLFDSFDSAQAGILINLILPDAESLVEGKTEIKYKGFTIGRIKSIKLQDDMQSVVAETLINPVFETFLTTGTRFWLVKPEVSLMRVRALETLVSGRYIEVDIGEGEPTKSFDVLMSPPTLHHTTPGLHLRLQSLDMASLSRGSEVFYRKIPVGFIQSKSLAEDGQSVWFEVFIHPEYAHLVTEKSRFWLIGGINIQGNLSGINFSTEPLMSLLRGGVAFSSTEKNAELAKNGDSFRLFDSQESAGNNSFAITLEFSHGEGVSQGTAIRYQGINIGKVNNISLDYRSKKVIAKASVNAGARSLVVENSQCWLVKPALSIREVSNLNTLITGPYIAIKPGRGKAQFRFDCLDSPPDKIKHKNGLNIELVSPVLGSLKSGVAVFYRQVPVGEIIGYRLSDDATSVSIFINIKNRYRQLVRKNTVFWNVSGVDFSAGWFQGVRLEADSLQSIISGGLALATPGGTEAAPLAKDGDSFHLASKPPENWMQWKPFISLSNH